MKNKRMKYIAMTMALIIGSMSITGCFGRFPVTRFVYRVNDNVSDSFDSQKMGGFFESIVMWIFAILPVYGLAMLGDAFIFNLIEFWTGDPIEISKHTTPDGKTITLAPTEDKDIAILSVEKDGQMLSENYIVRISDTVCEVRSSNGKLEGKMIRTADGSISLTDQKGQEVSMVSQEDLAALGLSS